MPRVFIINFYMRFVMIVPNKLWEIMVGFSARNMESIVVSIDRFAKIERLVIWASRSKIDHLLDFGSC